MPFESESGRLACVLFRLTSASNYESPVIGCYSTLQGLSQMLFASLSIQPPSRGIDLIIWNDLKVYCLLCCCAGCGRKRLARLRQYRTRRVGCWTGGGHQKKWFMTSMCAEHCQRMNVIWNNRPIYSLGALCVHSHRRPSSSPNTVYLLPLNIFPFHWPLSLSFFNSFHSFISISHSVIFL